MIKVSFPFIVLVFIIPLSLVGQSNDDLMPVRGLCIQLPSSDRIDEFITFIEEDLAPNGVNTLVLRVDYNYEYDSHPELRRESAVSRKQVKKIVKAAKKNRIDLIPQINLLGHQSWHENTGNLLSVYPEFDETPQITLPEKYQWPNDDNLYCKSYCPLHPGVHAIVFDLVDEIMDAFEATAFHAGMDEVFYLGDPGCTRCSGKDRSELFAGEVRRIRDHLKQENRELWIWGDRLLDGAETGLGMWEASMNDTHRAIDLIPKDVVICDWHYERAEPTAAYFAMKGFNVITCPWNQPEVAMAQLEQFLDFRKNSNPTLSKRYLGMMQTVWSGAESFMLEIKKSKMDISNGSVKSYLELFEEINSLND